MMVKAGASYHSWPLLRHGLTITRPGIHALLSIVPTCATMQEVERRHAEGVLERGPPTDGQNEKEAEQWTY